MDFYEIRQKEEKFFVDYFAIDRCFFKQPLVYIKKRAWSKTSTPKLYAEYIKQPLV